jgi:hypothetical protein
VICNIVGFSTGDQRVNVFSYVEVSEHVGSMGCCVFAITLFASNFDGITLILVNWIAVVRCSLQVLIRLSQAVSDSGLLIAMNIQLAIHHNRRVSSR